VRFPCHGSTASYCNRDPGIVYLRRRRPFLILSRLARNPDRIVSTEEFWRYAWGDRKPVNSESLHVYVYRLRRKLAPFGPRIDTMVNVGYRLLPAASA
jgi:DNA-binding response OmpR family regulator